MSSVIALSCSAAELRMNVGKRKRAEYDQKNKANPTESNCQIKFRIYEMCITSVKLTCVTI